MDGYYHSDSIRYRIRVPLHLQSMLRDGFDKGTHLLIDARGSVADRTVLNGYNQTDKIKINLIYTE